MSFQSYKTRIDELATRKGSTPDRIKFLILSRDILDKPMTSQEIRTVLYAVTGKKIYNLAPYMQIFQDNGIVRRTKTNDSNEILWYGSWDTSKAPVKKVESGPFSKNLIVSLGKEFSTEFKDLSLVYGQSGTCTAFMLRKILEKATFLALIKNGVSERELKDSSGKYIGLQSLLVLASKKKVKGLSILNSKTISNMKGIKFLGDTSAHNYLANVEMDDLIPQMPFINVGLKEISVWLK